MSKTIKSKVFEAENKWYLWNEIAEDPQALKDRNKTKHEAECLANYFEGLRDGLLSIKND